MRIAAAIAGALVLSACASGSKGWHVDSKQDTFTDVQTCRVIHGSEFDRAFTRGLLQVGIAYYFFAENRGGQVRAGLISEPRIPIVGDVQIRIDQNALLTITTADTPLDMGMTYVMPEMPGISAEVKAQMEATMKQASTIASPYRVFTDDKAKELLRQAISGKEIRYRIVGVNSYMSTTGELSTVGLAEALSRCGISP